MSQVENGTIPSVRALRLTLPASISTETRVTLGLTTGATLSRSYPSRIQPHSTGDQLAPKSL